MSTTLMLYPVLATGTGRFWCATALWCDYATHELADAIVSLGTLEGVEGRLVHQGAGETGANRFLAEPEVPSEWRGHARYRAVVSAAQLLAVPWETLSRDPEGTRLKRTAWAYIGVLDPDTLVIVEMAR